MIYINKIKEKELVHPVNKLYDLIEQWNNLECSLDCTETTSKAKYISTLIEKHIKEYPKLWQTAYRETKRYNQFAIKF